MSRRRVAKQMNNRPPAAKINVDVKTLPEIECPNCKGIYFQPVIQVKRVSALISPNGQEQEITLTHLQCNGCGWVINRVEPGKSGIPELPLTPMAVLSSSTKQ